MKQAMLDLAERVVRGVGYSKTQISRADWRRALPSHPDFLPPIRALARKAG